MLLEILVGLLGLTSAFFVLPLILKLVLNKEVLIRKHTFYKYI